MGLIGTHKLAYYVMLNKNVLNNISNNTREMMILSFKNKAIIKARHSIVVRLKNLTKSSYFLFIILFERLF